MFNLVLLKKEFKSNFKILLIFALVLTMYGAIIVSMFDPKLVDSLNSMVESMPQMFATLWLRVCLRCLHYLE